MTLRQRSILTVGLASLASAVIFSVSLLYLVRSTLNVSENPSVRKGLEIAIAAADDPAERAEALQAFRAYHQLNAVRGLIHQRIPIAGLAFGVVVFLLSLGISSLVLMRITRPFKELTTAINRAGTGDLTVRVSAPPRSEVGAVAEAFNRMTGRLRRLQNDLRRTERLAAWRDVARILGHEVRNPLTPIRLSIERLQLKSQQQSPDLPEVIEKSTATILEEIATLDRIVREFSEFARLPAPRPKPTDIEQLIAGVVNQYAIAVPDIHFTTGLEVKQWTLDPNLIRQVLTNVIKNSTEALRQVKRPGEITVTTTRTDHGCRITLTDNGPGIPDEIRDRVMEPYFTTKTKGTGLGLAVTRNIVAEHHGTIRIDTPEQGIRIAIDLPEGDEGESQTTGH